MDEVPQLLNVLVGEMSLVGPRPEDPEIVARHYHLHERRTLEVRPGMASAGSIYSYTHGEASLTGPDPEDTYLRCLLPVKLALELAYLEKRSVLSDWGIIFRTALVLLQRATGKRRFPEPPEMARALELLAQHRGLTNERCRATCDRAGLVDAPGSRPA